MSTTHTYDPAFFASISDGSARSARRIVPLVLSLTAIRSVVDVGCGDGVWLAEFLRLGVGRIHGLDGGAVESSQLKIPADAFQSCDLGRGLSLAQTFDLAVSLEVAEHLPPSRAESFVADLVRLAPRVLFSAAIPFQRGTHHVNCQWPDYWQSLFARHGYVALDAIRPRLWHDDSVEFWYRQNAVLYVHEPLLEREERLQALAPAGRPRLERMVHPELCERWDEFSLREVLGLLPRALKSALVRRLSGATGGPRPGASVRTVSPTQPASSS